MKHIRHYFCTALLGTAVLTACSGAEKVKSNTPVQITMWNYYNGAQKEEMDRLVQEFNDTVGLEQKIVVESVSKGSVSELEDAVRDSTDGKTGSDPLPDFCSLYADAAYDLWKKDKISDFRPYLTDEEYDSYISGYLEEGNFGTNAAMMIFPVAKSTEVLTINSTAWEPFASETGASLEELSTWEGLAQTAKAYYEWTDAKTETPNDGQAFFGRDSFANYILIGSHQLGHTIYSGENGSISVDVDPDTMRRLWDNFYVPYISGYYLEEGRFRSDDLKTGKLIAYVGSSSGAVYAPDQVTYDDGSTETVRCDILPLPGFAGEPSCAVQQGAGAVMFRTDEQKEKAVVTFLKWLTREENNIPFCTASGYLPVTKAASDVERCISCMKEQGLELNPNVETMLKTAIPQIKEYELYTTSPFSGAQDARKVIDSTLPERARADRQKVLELISSGVSLEAAVSECNTEEAFESWCEDTKEQLINLK